MNKLTFKKATYFCESLANIEMDVEGFTGFVKDHIQHFNAIPCEYVEFDEEGEETMVLDCGQVFRKAEELGLVE